MAIAIHSNKRAERAQKGIQKKTQRHARLKLFFTIAASIALLFFLLNMRPIVNALGLVDKERYNCPRAAGNESANLEIKYFDSAFCLYCILEESVLQTMIEKRGSLFALHKYDTYRCPGEFKKYDFVAVPSFVFIVNNESREYKIQGYINEAKFEEIVCGLSGGCIA
ncbi:hypothetical protein HZB03_02170 [Candidatus Woesearchaeota archaeon]|nr:hypothetical protein [Candidatus Woesearchaeota archaeon]